MKDKFDFLEEYMKEYVEHLYECIKYKREFMYFLNIGIFLIGKYPPNEFPTFEEWYEKHI